MAAHIAAAASGKGARRYVASMTSEERSAASNGIWMCYAHGKLIDTDEVRFSISMLQQWKKVAELRARIEHESAGKLTLSTADLKGFDLVPEAVWIAALGRESRPIGDALEHSCVPMVWGREVADALRDFFIEIARNALSHGKASAGILQIDQTSVSFVDDGAHFDPRGLSSHDSGRGGAHAVRQLLDQFGTQLVLTTRRRGALNLTSATLVRRVSDIKTATPCVIELRGPEGTSTPEAHVLEACETIFVVTPPYLTYSDVYVLHHMLGDDARHLRRFVFVVSSTSARVQDMLRAEFPTCQIMNVAS